MSQKCASWASASPMRWVTRGGSTRSKSRPARLVSPRSRYSAVRLRKPSAPSAKPELMPPWMTSPSPSKVWPTSARILVSPVACFSTMLITPAMASEPYWAAAPSRNTSMRSMAETGMALMSVPAEPRPMVCCTFTSACWWRRLPLISTSTWSGPRARSVAGRMMSVPSLMKVREKLNDGCSICRICPSSCAPLRWMSSEPSTSTGASVSSSTRPTAREPVTTSSSTGSACCCAEATGAKARPIARASARFALRPTRNS